MSHEQKEERYEHHDQLHALECAMDILGKQLNYLINQGVHIMASLQDLKDKVDALEAAEAAREARDVAQDAVTTAQVAALQASIDSLNAIIAAGGLSPENQATIDGISTKLDAVITSLNAADPTPPVV